MEEELKSSEQNAIEPQPKLKKFSFSNFSKKILITTFIVSLAAVSALSYWYFFVYETEPSPPTSPTPSEARAPTPALTESVLNLIPTNKILIQNNYPEVPSIRELITNIFPDPEVLSKIEITENTDKQFHIYFYIDQKREIGNQGTAHTFETIKNGWQFIGLGSSVCYTNAGYINESGLGLMLADGNSTDRFPGEPSQENYTNCIDTNKYYVEVLFDPNGFWLPNRTNTQAPLEFDSSSTWEIQLPQNEKPATKDLIEPNLIYDTKDQTGVTVSKRNIVTSEETNIFECTEQILNKAKLLPIHAITASQTIMSRTVRTSIVTMDHPQKILVEKQPFSLLYQYS